MNIRIAFLFGLTRDSKDQKILDEGSRLFGDVIQSKKFVDDYMNLTLKSIQMLKWTNSFCPKVGLLLKTDDDMFLRMDNLLRWAGYTRFACSR